MPAMTYFINPRRARVKAAKGARFGAIKNPKRAKRKGATVAKKKGKKRTATKKKGGRRKATTAKRRSPVTTLARRRVYVTNPRRRTRRRSYRRNPGIAKQVIGLGKDTAVVLVGSAASRFVGNLIPFGNDGGLAGVAKGALIAVGIRTFGARFVGADMARLAAVGAMIGPLQSAIAITVPGAAQFFGVPEVAAASLSSYSSDYIGGGELADGSGMDSYSEAFG